MKKLFIVCVLGLLSFSSHAQVRRWFHQPMNCFVDGTGARCQVTNFRFRPIYCEAEAFAITSFRFRLNGFFRGWIQPRNSGFIFIRANNPWRDPVVAANARARCLF